MIQQIALARLLGKILSLPSSAATGPEEAKRLGLNVLARPELVGVWAIAERIAPDGKLSDVLSRVVSALKTPDGQQQLLAQALPVKDLVIGALPRSLQGPADFIVSEHSRDPEALKAYLAESFDPKEVVEYIAGKVAVSKPYRCPACDLPFFSSLPSQDVSCPHCES